MKKFLSLTILLICATAGSVSAAPAATGTNFEALPANVADQLQNPPKLLPQSGALSASSLSASSPTPAITYSSWNGSGNLGNISQTNFTFYEYFYPPNTVPASALLTSLQWGWQARNTTSYPLTVFLCIGNTNTCLNVTNSTSGQVSLIGNNFSARSQIFYVMYASASSTVVFPTPIYAYQEYIFAGYSY